MTNEDIKCIQGMENLVANLKTGNIKTRGISLDELPEKRVQVTFIFEGEPEINP